MCPMWGMVYNRSAAVYQKKQFGKHVLAYTVQYMNDSCIG